MNKLYQELEAIQKDFIIGCSSIKLKTYNIPSPNQQRKVQFTESKIRNALNTILSNHNLSDLLNDFNDQLENTQRLLAFCSSPKAFQSAWNMRSQVISFSDAESILKYEGQLIPVNDKERFLKTEQQGVILHKSKRFPIGIRHSEGNYDDTLDDLGIFEYQPPGDVSGVMRYRFYEYISKKLNIDLLLIAVMWFKYRINDQLNHVFVLCPTKVIPGDINSNFFDDISRPLKLQTITRNDAFLTLNRLRSLNESSLELTVRPELSDDMVREWSYEKIKTGPKGLKIKKWAQKTGQECPDCLTPFNQFTFSNIAFGHIVSQNWSRSFTFLLDKVNHPDNLYLTCQNCNSSLGDRFPSGNLRSSILQQNTIGDWLRSNEEIIRNIK